MRVTECQDLYSGVSSFQREDLEYTSLMKASPGTVPYLGLVVGNRFLPARGIQTLLEELNYLTNSHRNATGWRSTWKLPGANEQKDD